MWAYGKIRSDVNNSIQPRMSTTRIVFEIYDLVDNSDHFLFLLQQQQQILKDVVLEMINLTTEKAPIEEEEKDEEDSKEESEEWKIDSEAEEPE